MLCPRCSQDKPDFVDHICDDCRKAENNRACQIRRENSDWVEICKEAGLDPWERQPAETDTEWRVWCAYRDSYPFRRLNYNDVAKHMLTTHNVVRRVAERWDFPVRMQMWQKHIDAITLQQRQQEIVDMNKRHVDMAKELNDKIGTFITNLNPSTIEVKDLKGLMQVATDLERKGRLDQTDVTKNNMASDENPELKKSPTDVKDLGEVVKILQAAGMIPGSATIGIETTQRVVIKDASV